MNTLKRIGLCLLCLLAVFGGWYVADPTYAFLQAPDAAHGPTALLRMTVYVTYIAAVFIPWICTTPVRTDGTEMP